MLPPNTRASRVQKVGVGPLPPKPKRQTRLLRPFTCTYAHRRVYGFLYAEENLLRDLAATFKALADETRLAILFLIVDHGELCVCDIEQALEISQSKASRHLRYLFNTGFLFDRREGPWVYYRVRDDLQSSHQRLLELIPELVLESAAQVFRGRLTRWLRQKEDGGPTCA